MTRKTDKAETLAQAAELARRSGGDDAFAWMSLPPARVGALMRAHEAGEFGTSMPAFEKACRCDFRIRTAAGKRYRAAAALRWEVLTTDGSEEALRQQRMLRRFYDTLTVSSAERRDENARLSTLILRMMSAVNFGYAAGELRWIPDYYDGAPTYRAHVETCPLAWFEARDRALRIVTDAGAAEGTPLAEDGWIVATSPDEPLIYPTMMIFLLRATPLQDWAETLEKYGRPIVYGETTASYRSPEWMHFMDALRRLSAGAACTVSPGAEIKVLPIAQNGSAPHKELLDMLDRALMSLWRGGDLSTMSRGGDGAGSNPQTEELDDIVAADAEFIEDLFEAQLTRPFLRRVFGDAEQKAWFALVREDPAADELARRAVERVHALGLPIPTAHVYEVFGVPAPEPDEASVLPGARAATLSNADEEAGWMPALDPATAAAFARAERETFAPALDAAALALDGDDEFFRANAGRAARAMRAATDRTLSNDDEARALADALKQRLRREGVA